MKHKEVEISAIAESFLEIAEGVRDGSLVLQEFDLDKYITPFGNTIVINVKMDVKKEQAK